LRVRARNRRASAEKHHLGPDPSKPEPSSSSFPPHGKASRPGRRRREGALGSDLGSAPRLGDTQSSDRWRREHRAAGGAGFTFSLRSRNFWILAFNKGLKRGRPFDDMKCDTKTTSCRTKRLILSAGSKKQAPLTELKYEKWHAETSFAAAYPSFPFPCCGTCDGLEDGFPLHQGRLSHHGTASWMGFQPLAKNGIPIAYGGILLFRTICS